MQTKSLIIVTLLIINHPAYAEQETLNPQSRTVTVKKSIQRNDTVKEKIVNQLIDRGLELEAAESLVEQKLKVPEKFITDLAALLEDISEEMILQRLAQQVLFKKEVAITSREEIIALTQSLGKLNLEKSTRKQLYRLVKNIKQRCFRRSECPHSDSMFYHI